jgi:CheY-like chemotaxis protein
MQVPAAEAALDLDVEYPTPLPEFIETDPTRLRQVLVNLVANAIKFTKAGQIRIVVRWLGSASDPWIEFAVIDSGIGMTSEVIGRLFDPFTQADASTTRLYGGTGLGLSICQRLVELMRGSIDVESQPGVGSTFRLRLPVSPDLGARLIPRPAAVVWNAESPPGPGTTVDQELDCRILLAEDGEAIRELVSRMLTRAGAIVEVAIDGEAAVQRALAAESQIPFDVVLMDIQMPALDGYAATRALRRAGYKRPIIALTAHARAEDRTRCLAAGCDDVAAKPFDKRSLIGLISRHTRPSSTDRGVGDPPNT